MNVFKSVQIYNGLLLSHEAGLKSVSFRQRYIAIQNSHLTIGSISRSALKNDVIRLIKLFKNIFYLENHICKVSYVECYTLHIRLKYQMWNKYITLSK